MLLPWHISRCVYEVGIVRHVPGRLWILKSLWQLPSHGADSGPSTTLRRVLSGLAYRGTGS